MERQSNAGCPQPLGAASQSVLYIAQIKFDFPISTAQEHLLPFPDDWRRTHDLVAIAELNRI